MANRTRLQKSDVRYDEVLHKILVVDDARAEIEQAVIEALKKTAGFSSWPTWKKDPKVSEEDLRGVSIVLLDYDFGSGQPSGVEFLTRLRKIRSEDSRISPKIFLLSNMRQFEQWDHSLEELYGLGVTEFLMKSAINARPELLAFSMSKALDLLKKEEVISSIQGAQGLLGDSQAMVDLRSFVSQVANNGYPVLLFGETGSGKDVAARAIHHQGRGKYPFWAVNMSALPSDLIETELFGHEKGAFTGADAPGLGKFELAGCGTIFLDEIGDASLPLQAKILRVLENREFSRVGGQKMLPVHARVIVATHQNLEQMVKERTFRQDLYYRLNVLPFLIRPLRERTEDIPVLAGHFLYKVNTEVGKTFTGITEEALDALRKHPWLGNVRELWNIIKRSVLQATGKGPLLDVADIRFAVSHGQRETSPGEGTRPQESNFHLPGKNLGANDLGCCLASSLIRFLSKPGCHLYRLTEVSRVTIGQFLEETYPLPPMHRRPLREGASGFEFEIEYASYDPEKGVWIYGGRVEKVVVTAPMPSYRKSRSTGDTNVVESRDWGVLTNEKIWKNVASEIQKALLSSAYEGSVQLNCLPEAIAIYLVRGKMKHHEVAACLFDPVCREHSENLQRQLLPGRSIVSRLKRNVSQGISDDPKAAENYLLRVYGLDER